MSAVRRRRKRYNRHEFSEVIIPSLDPDPPSHGLSGGDQKQGPGRLSLRGTRTRELAAVQAFSWAGTELSAEYWVTEGRAYSRAQPPSPSLHPSPYTLFHVKKDYWSTLRLVLDTPESMDGLEVKVEHVMQLHYFHVAQTYM